VGVEGRVMTCSWAWGVGLGFRIDLGWYGMGEVCEVRWIWWVWLVWCLGMYAFGRRREGGECPLAGWFSGWFFRVVFWEVTFFWEEGGWGIVITSFLTGS